MLADRYGPSALLIAGPLLLAPGFGLLAVCRTYDGLPGSGKRCLVSGHAALSGPPATILWQTLHEHGQGHRYLHEEGRIHGLRLCGTGTAFLLGGLLAEALATPRATPTAIAIVATCAWATSWRH
ncbi:MAG: hypothetical protein IPK26_23965 [Planctomycetes bacterium]|nr:hypothetical protein [Planctomycetota bacterium]